jgi:predicted permease
MLSHLWNDFRYAARRLSASPGFTAAAVLTIALGVGINTGIFSVINGVVARDLPAPAANELVGIHQLLDDTTMRQRFRNGEVSDFSTSEYRTYRDRTKTLSGIMGYSRSNEVTLGGETPQEIGGTLVTCNYFDVLRRPPALGPGFSSDCDAEGAVPVVVLGHDLWTSAFGADPAIVGRAVLLNRQSFTVAGVAPEGMRGVDIEPASFFAPISTQPLLAPLSNSYRGEWSWLRLIGRRADDTSLDQVRAELGVIAAEIDAREPPRKTTLVVARAVPASPEERAEMLPVIVVVMVAFGLVLLIACANVANLLLARATGRSREIAVRLALGASRSRVVQQLLVESVVIAIIGGTLGALLAMWSSQSLVFLALSALPAQLPTLALDASPDIRVLAFAFVLTLGSGVLFGLVPALHLSKPDLHTTMKVEVTGAGRRSGGRLQGTLLGVQVAVCMVLMIAAGLLLRGLYATQTVEPGFTYENVAVASFDLTGAGYDPARAAVFRRELVERVASLPGIEAVAQVAIPPLTGGGMGFMARPADQEQWLSILFNAISPSYFSTIGIPIVRGRTFTDAELEDRSGVIIVTEATARRFWPGQDPLGQTIVRAVSRPSADGSAQTAEYRVVGVAKDAEITNIGEIPSNYVYVPAGSGLQAQHQLLAKSRIDFAATAASIRAAAAELDAALVVRVAPLEANLDYWRSLARLVGTLSTSLGVLALVLAAVGVYGVVAYAVGRRVREIGIRRALGASARSVVALTLKRSMLPVVIGAVVGAAAAAGISRILTSMLFGVSPLDPLGLGLATLFVLAVALTAGLLPARRATRVDPMTTLRYE